VPLNNLPSVCGALPSRRYDGIISSSLIWRLRLPKRLFARHPPETLRFSGSLLGMIQGFAINQYCLLIRYFNLL
jgi:hypothetical protein